MDHKAFHSAKDRHDKLLDEMTSYYTRACSHLCSCYSIGNHNIYEALQGRSIPFGLFSGSKLTPLPNLWAITDVFINMGSFIKDVARNIRINSRGKKPEL